MNGKPLQIVYQNGLYHMYCKTLNVSLPFISRAKQNCEIKGREYQL